jgi:hypothetical protein
MEKDKHLVYNNRYFTLFATAIGQIHLFQDARRGIENGGL